MKKNLLWFILGGLIFGTIGVGAAYVYTARDINYQPSDENWNVENVQEALTELKTDINTITNKVEGIERVYKAGEVELVALVSDDSFYTDSNGKYVLANSDTGRTLLADTSTYKSLASTEDTRGEVGADTCSPFKKEVDLSLTYTTYANNWVGKVIYTNTTNDTQKLVIERHKDNNNSYTGAYVYVDGTMVAQHETHYVNVVNLESGKSITMTTESAATGVYSITKIVNA